MLNAGKLVTRLKGLTSNEFTSEVVKLLKRSAGESFYFDHVHAVGKRGEKYCLKPVKVYVQKS